MANRNYLFNNCVIKIRLWLESRKKISGKYNSILTVLPPRTHEPATHIFVLIFVDFRCKYEEAKLGDLRRPEIRWIDDSMCDNISGRKGQQVMAEG